MTSRSPAHLLSRAIAPIGWTFTLTGLAIATLGYLMARDDVLVEGFSPLVLGLYQAIATTFYRLTGIYINHDVLELLVGSLALSGAAFGIGLLIGHAIGRGEDATPAVQAPAE